ncbi:hypothetical protein DVB69_00785 [Sporosarcina sp. BI001-red]|uniref:hypothetical protein n=1 Tax=Sporosarcina sp. BI001-red TaxID=2282866 RepID=UPI000E27387B|nr:hypothetical protein [Sporosarcina sp. BI001-red]REB11478.1 hypothetical protein DVB69_00785 [Sporosarcina sp. BI001-red]
MNGCQIHSLIKVNKKCSCVNGSSSSNRIKIEFNRITKEKKCCFGTVKILEMEVLVIKKLLVPILIVFIISLMGGSYFILRLDAISNLTVILLTLSLIILPLFMIYWLFIRPSSMPKLLAYLAFIICLGASYLIIPSSQKGFFSKMMVWLLLVLEISVLIVVIYGIFKSVKSYRRNKQDEDHDFLDVIRMSLEPKLGNGFVLGAILTEMSVFYYSIIGWFRKPTVIKNEDAYSYHKTSQLKTMTIIFSILIILEGASFHFLIQSWSGFAAWTFTVFNIYALLYIIGLYNSVRSLPHIMTSDKVIIRFGYQSSIEFEVSNIEDIKTAKEQGGIGEKKPKDTYFAMLNMDSPQYEIFLKEPVLMKSSYGRKKYVKTVVFRTDEPARMVEDLNSNIEFLSNG